MSRHYYEELLNIRTTEEQMGFPQSFHFHRYEPTPYSALEELFAHYKLSEHDRLVDFGCGKGRLNFYLHHLFNLSVTGVEMNEDLYRQALGNLEHYTGKGSKGKKRIQFLNCLAQDYKIHPKDNHFYFFNPFSIQIFMTVIQHILISLEDSYRPIDLILYYPSEDYMYYLERQTPFILKEEIRLSGYDKDPFEKFLIYQYGY